MQLEQDLADKLKAIDTLDQSSQEYLDAVQGVSDLNDKIEGIKQANAKIEALKKHTPVTKGLSESANGLQFNRIERVREGFESDPKCGFKSGGEFLSAVFKSGNVFESDSRFAHIMQTSGSHTTAADGIVIPPDFAQGLLLNESGIMDDWMDRMIIEPTSLNSKTFKRSASNTLGGSVGIQASRINENTQMTPSKEKFEMSTVNLEKLYAYSEVTEEDMSDIAWLESHLQKQAPKVIRKKYAGEVMSGTGVGQALGMFNANNSNKIQVTRNTASDVKAADIANMFARHIQGAGSFWVINRDTLAKIPLITVGDQVVTWQSFFQNGQVGNLMGLPVYLSEHCSALGSAGDVRLINPDGYRNLEKTGGLQFASSIHVKFDYDKTALRWTHRINGIPWANAVYSPTNGSTLSCFVELGTA